MRLLLRPEAIDELAETPTWYESRRRGLGDEFLRSVEAALARILRQPSASVIVHGDVRSTVLKRFPYALFHATDGDVVVILGCIHQNRDPRVWPRLES